MADFRIAVLSPHLDDAVLSLGATVSAWSRRGMRAMVVTVLANDPDAVGPARPWDALCGFRSAAQAARDRRREDERACRRLGAEPVWLPYGDEEHGRGADDAEISAHLRAVTAGVEVVLVPGYPLLNPDHAWLTDLVRATGLGAARIDMYVEQPYASSYLMGRSRRRGHTKPLIRGVAALGRFAVSGRGPAGPERGDPELAVRPGPGDWAAKQAAIAEYRSQLPALGPLLRCRIGLYDLGGRGERIWQPDPTAPGSGTVGLARHGSR